MKKKPTKAKEADVSSDPVAELVSGDSEEEFPYGFIWFAVAAARWFGTYIVATERTVTGKKYEIQREGTKVDVRDMETLLEIREEVYCPRDNKSLTVAPIGITRL